MQVNGTCNLHLLRHAVLNRYWQAHRNTAPCYISLLFAFQRGRVHIVACIMSAGGNPGNHVTWHPVARIELHSSCRVTTRVYISKVLFIVVMLGSGRDGGGIRIPFSLKSLSSCDTTKLTQWSQLVFLVVNFVDVCRSIDTREWTPCWASDWLR